MNIKRTNMNDLVVIDTDVYGDSRGFFLEIFNQKKLSDLGFNWQFVQTNHSRSKFATLRGLHYQGKYPQGKLAYVIRGKVFDVAVDLRVKSNTFGKWHGEILSEENHKLMYIPPGFAHGFLVLSEYADFIYQCTDFYHPHDEKTIRWNDSQLGIDWPLPKGVDPILSTKDEMAQKFSTISKI
jgi:dTDP-4-dehydrorhamnose 3,5-epimerase